MTGMTGPRRRNRFNDGAEHLLQSTIDYLRPHLGRRPTTIEIAAAWVAWLGEYERTPPHGQPDPPDLRD